MSKGKFDLDRRLYSEFLTRCHEEGLDPDEVLEAWVKRAVRQKRTIMPSDGMDDSQDRRQVLAMRGPKAS